jgi:hypothetical protein
MAKEQVHWTATSQPVDQLNEWIDLAQERQHTSAIEEVLVLYDTTIIQVTVYIFIVKRVDHLLGNPDFCIWTTVIHHPLFQSLCVLTLA